jgi:hypothetical protein
VERQRQREVAQVVDGKLHFPPFRRALLRQRHHAGIVHQHVQRIVPAGRKSADGLTIREIQAADARAASARAPRNLGGRPRAGLDLAHRERHRGAGRGQRPRRLDPDARRAAGDDDLPAREVDAGGHVRGGGVEAE